jgi:hypothetical protein
MTGMVAHICNLSYSGDRDWEDQGLRPAQAKSFNQQAEHDGALT